MKRVPRNQWILNDWNRKFVVNRLMNAKTSMSRPNLNLNCLFTIEANFIRDFLAGFTLIFFCCKYSWPGFPPPLLYLWLATEFSCLKSFQKVFILFKSEQSAFWNYLSDSSTLLSKYLKFLLKLNLPLFFFPILRLHEPSFPLEPNRAFSGKGSPRSQV